MNSILLFLLLAMLGASQSNGSGVRPALERRYDELARATERLDLAAFVAVRHETFHSVLPDGRIAGPMEMNEYSQQFFRGLLPPVSLTFTIRALSVSGDGMVAAVDVFQELSRFREFEEQRQKARNERRAAGNLDQDRPRMEVEAGRQHP